MDCMALLRRFASCLWLMPALMMLAIMTPAAVARTDPQWSFRFYGEPTTRENHAMAYDVGRRRVVLFGGYDSSNRLGDTWEWDGASWARRTTTGPTPRDRHAMAYDAARGRVVLFGGDNDGGPQGDTWEWDGTAWTQRATTGPPARYGHAMAFDAARGRVVLFGGSVDTDTWEWNGNMWSQHTTTGPSARFWHAMAYDAARTRLVLFGGQDDFGALGDTWEWDGTAWSQRATTGPSMRFGHAMAYDAARERMVLFGGYDAGWYGDTWEWDGTAWLQRATTGPSPRYRPAIAYDTARGRVVLSGGTDGGYPGDTWELPSDFIYTTPGQESPPQPPQYPPDPPPPTPVQDKLIVVTHGWNTDQCTFDNFWQPLADAIEAQVGPEWKVEAYNWTSDSLTGDGFIAGPDLALLNGLFHGYRLGRRIDQELIEGEHYEHVHLIAHSAGSALIAGAASRINHFSDSTTVHTTYLDAYAGTFVIAGIGNYEEAYGGNAQWSEHYFSRERLGLCDGTGPLTELDLPRSVNFDVTSIDPGFDVFCISSHAWPRCYYAFTADNGTSLAHCDEDEMLVPCGEPNGELPGYGFPLSLEQWTGSGGYIGWLAYLESFLEPGEVYTLSDGALRGEAPAQDIVFRTRRDPPIDLGVTQTFLSNPAAVQVAAGIVTMATQPPGAAAAPAWINFQINDPERINFVAFDLAFTSDPVAAGLATLYVNESERGKVDEPYVLPGFQTYAMPTPGELAPGEHVVSFRLDPFSALPSSISITNIATGWGGFVNVGDVNVDGVVTFADITMVLTFWGAVYPPPESSGPGDANGDGAVTFADITKVLTNWGAVYP
jgi:hypothetical protein